MSYPATHQQPESLCIQGATILTPIRIIRRGAVVVQGKWIKSVEEGIRFPAKDCPTVRANGLFVAPGFIDVHVHGGGGYEVAEGSRNALAVIARIHAQGGTTSWLATVFTTSPETLTQALNGITEAMESDLGGAKLLGAHLEGPYLNPDYAGAQNKAFLRNPDPNEYMSLLDEHPCIRMMSAAPELPGALDLGRELRSRGIIAAIGHSGATYNQVLEAVESGYSHITHVYSAMSSAQRIGAYRIAGVLEAALILDELTVEVIGDGHHLPPSLLKLVLRTKDVQNVCAITDANPVAGLGPGKYVFGGLPIVVDGEVPGAYEVTSELGLAPKLIDKSAFAGSVATMNVVLRNLVHLGGLSLLEAIKTVTLVPARLLGISRERGMVAPGMAADLVVFDSEFNVRLTIVEGKIVHNKLGKIHG